MDPVSAAGLALSALSLSFQVFSGCVKGYELLVGIDGFEKKYDYLRHLLLVEQHRFLNWAAVANISVDKQGFGEGAWLLEQPTVLGSLKQMQSLLLDLDQLDKKFSLVLRRSDGPTEGIYSGPKKPTLLSRNSQMIEKALAVAAKSNIYPRRLRLLTLDPSKFENLISNLRLLNDSILTFLNSHQQKRHTELQERTFVQVLETNNRLDDLQSLLQSFQVSLSPPSQSTEDRRRQMELAQFKMLSMAISEAAKSKSSNIEFLFSTKPLSLEEIHFTEQDDTSARNVSTGKYGGSPIWIEWRDCTHLPMSPSINVVRDRIANLAVLLQGARTLKDFNVPACLGYVDFPTEDRIGLVFRPRQADHSGIPLSLYELLKSRPKPSLTVRIQLARTIATSLWYLHAANWMHKGLRSGNIVFEDAANICSPLLAGFDYSRPAEAGEGTDKATENRIHELYRHPAVQFDVPRDGNYGFRKLHDVYALGVVLFEIGTWQCIEDFLDVGSDDYVRRQDIKEVKGTLLSNQSMERLAGEAGVVFSGCIKFCLEQGGKDIGLWLGDGEYAHREFELRILDALRSINV